ncbi:MAG: hypothetical protein IPP43_03400 [Chitinophagaceae bacterium]|nr:hypothetical protein [Chitinophagaceae bacterium]
MDILIKIKYSNKLIKQITDCLLVIAPERKLLFFKAIMVIVIMQMRLLVTNMEH